MREAFAFTGRSGNLFCRVKFALKKKQLLQKMSVISQVNRILYFG